MAAAITALACLAQSASAASLNGHKLLEARGPTGAATAGSLTLGGLIEFNGDGGAKFVAITLNYVEHVQSDFPVLCKLNTPGDVKDEYDEKTGVGTFSITIGKNDACIDQTTDKPPLDPVDGKTITFDLYHGAGLSKIVSTSSGLVNSFGNTIESVDVAGSLTPAR
jgi:hypothetical protein